MDFAYRPQWYFVELHVAVPQESIGCELLQEQHHDGSSAHQSTGHWIWKPSPAFIGDKGFRSPKMGNPASLQSNYQIGGFLIRHQDCILILGGRINTWKNRKLLVTIFDPKDISLKSLVKVVAFGQSRWYNLIGFLVALTCWANIRTRNL